MNLKSMNDIKRTKCKKCDYLNHNVAIIDKKPNCFGMETMLSCNAYMETIKLIHLVGGITGEIGPLFVCKNIHNGTQED